MWASNLAFGVLLAACVERQSLPSDPTGRLFARGLDEITDLYIAPVSDRKLILAGAARFSRLDDKFSVTESAGAEGKTQIALEYAYRYALSYSAVFWIACVSTRLPRHSKMPRAR